MTITLAPNWRVTLFRMGRVKMSPIVFCSNQTETTFQTQTEMPGKRLEGSDEAHDRGVLLGKLATESQNGLQSRLSIISYWLLKQNDNR